MRYNQPCVCGRSSSGRARPCQGRGSEFEPRRPLQKEAPSLRMVLFFACSAALTVVSAGCRPLARCGSRDTSSKPPRFIRRRRRFGAFLVARGRVIESARETRLRFPLHTPPLPCGMQGCGQQIQLPCGESRMAAVISGSPVSGWEGAQCQTVCARDAITGSVSRLSSVDSVTRWAA